MDSGFGSALAAQMFWGFVLALILTFCLGAGCYAGCSYVARHLTVKVGVPR